MRDYLDEFPHNFVGYIGQTDETDNLPNKNRIKSQRSCIYDPYVTALFRIPKYNVSSEEVFSDINLKLIRRIHDKKKEYTLSVEQMDCYSKFLIILQENVALLQDFMTRKVQKKYYGT
jgi:hypothetical protein